MMNALGAVQKVLLPGWQDDIPFEAKLRRPSLLSMAASGLIPNELMTAAQKLFSEGYNTQMPLDQLGRLLETIAAQALVEPTLAQLEEADCRLTDMQLAAIYNFTQAGVRALEPFRLGGTDTQPAGYEQAILGASE